MLGAAPNCVPPDPGAGRPKLGAKFQDMRQGQALGHGLALAPCQPPSLHLGCVIWRLPPGAEDLPGASRQEFQVIPTEPEALSSWPRLQPDRYS